MVRRRARRRVWVGSRCAAALREGRKLFKYFFNEVNIDVHSRCHLLGSNRKPWEKIIPTVSYNFFSHNNYMVCMYGSSRGSRVWILRKWEI